MSNVSRWVSGWWGKSFLIHGEWVSNELVVDVCSMIMEYFGTKNEGSFKYEH